MLTDPVNEQPTIRVRLKSTAYRGMDLGLINAGFLSISKCELVSKIHQCDGDSARPLIQSPTGKRYAY